MDDSIDPPRQSLLDVTQEKLQKQGKTVVLSRVLFVIQTSDKHNSSKTEIEAAHSAMLKAARGETDKETGLLIVFPNCIVHMLETTTKMIFTYLRQLLNAEGITSMKIISSTEDIPSRAFQKWYCSFVNSQTQEHYDGDEGESLVNVASDANIALIKLGKHVSALGQRDADSSMESLRTSYPDLPQIDPFMIVCHSEEAPSVREFLDIYDSPVDIDLESENVWPMPVPLTF
ncbi:hypothetical protein CYMTET_7826 [Cymbomonas tetramitiformis]|uniref:BLUF domain-containing protein n=1 Tax=Cymbomonas tetramitiformis TaxID=36881 RepID=A0AAE0GUA0_9CHLO|nr:hypothetical protein CYMTET_7826 [Cymbomonas tetramitiformis]|eukprot:gene8975-10630_t